MLPHCHAWLVPDHWKPYYKYDALHALCNQHLLRELKFLAEEHHAAWAADLSRFLLDWKDDPLRTLAGACIFARIRSYLSTCRKQGHNLWEACYKLVIGTPILPQAPESGP